MKCCCTLGGLPTGVRFGVDNCIWMPERVSEYSWCLNIDRLSIHVPNRKSGKKSLHNIHTDALCHTHHGHVVHERTRGNREAREGKKTNLVS